MMLNGAAAEPDRDTNLHRKSRASNQSRSAHSFEFYCEGSEINTAGYPGDDLSSIVLLSLAI